MTETQAKEILIDLINYMAYKETDRSLFTVDKNRLFGESHYCIDPAIASHAPSPWGEGEVFEQKMAQLLQWGSRSGCNKASLDEAIKTLQCGDHYLNRIIRKAGLLRSLARTQRS
jgi:hypothetical protein